MIELEAEREVAQMALGLAVFESLQAEDEAAWLERFFVPPRDFDFMVGGRSLVVFGAEGSGKTALYQALMAYDADETGKPVHLPVPWQPEVAEITPPSQPAGLADARNQIEVIFRETVSALGKFILRWPASFAEAPAWARERLGWFLQMYGPADLHQQLGPQLEKASPTGQQVLAGLLAQQPAATSVQPAAPERVASSLGQALHTLGLDGVWVLYDSPLIWSAAQEEALTAELTAFLSTLPLFELKHFTFKLIMPARMERKVISASGFRRRRLDRFYLTWELSQLRQLIEARLSAAFGRPAFSLTDLCQAKSLPIWLEKVGGGSPRAWLEQIRPLIAAYHRQEKNAPLTKKQWLALRHDYAPWLYFDDVAQEITIGQRTLTAAQFSEQAYKLFVYLYSHKGQVVSKGELYYRIYRGLDSVPRVLDDAYEHPDVYTGTIDTAIWRLRNLIEPDPRHPLFITSVHGQGLRLERCA